MNKHRFNIFPEMNPEEFAMLRADIQNNGYDSKNPIYIYHREILDGWNRYPRADEVKLHPTQKPLPLLKKLIELFTDPGEVVIDPVAGSGSTLVAAMHTGRKSFGFEIKKDFYKDAKNWIDFA